MPVSQVPGAGRKSLIVVEDLLKLISQGGHHASNGVIEGGFAVEVRLPESLQEVEIVFPAALVESFANRIGTIPVSRNAATFVSLSRGGRGQHRADNFAGGVEDQSMPEIARNGLVVLMALANDGGLHRFRDPVRAFVE